MFIQNRHADKVNSILQKCQTGACKLFFAIKHVLSKQLVINPTNAGITKIEANKPDLIHSLPRANSKIASLKNKNGVNIIIASDAAMKKVLIKIL